MPTQGVYAIRNKANGRVYIGASVNAEARFSYHLRGWGNRAIRRDALSYGVDSFAFELLETVARWSDLRDAEQRWIDQFDADALYNVAPQQSRNNWGHVRRSRSTDQEQL